MRWPCYDLQMSSPLDCYCDDGSLVPFPSSDPGFRRRRASIVRLCYSDRVSAADLKMMHNWVENVEPLY